MKLRVLVVDDSILFRRAVADALAALPDVEVVGSAPNGKIALQKARELRPDLITLDMEMPELGGLEVLDSLRGSGDPAAVIVLSSLTSRGGKLTMQALEKGAFDFITKPDAPGAEESRKALRLELGPRLRALAHRLEVRAILRQKPAPTVTGEQTPPEPATRFMPAGLDSVEQRMNNLVARARPELVLIGVSTGGPNALLRVLPAIPKDIGVPILIVQHMPPVFTKSLAESLAEKCAIRVVEASDGEQAEPGTAYIAPGGRQMRLARGAAGGKLLQITDAPPENNCRPAVDYLFRSVANSFPGSAAAVILTGMGSDGTIGLRLLKRHGCFVIAQDEATCVVYGMPKAAVEAGVTDVVVPLDAIPGRIISVVRGF